jgi:hypothetical protein
MSIATERPGSVAVPRSRTPKEDGGFCTVAELATGVLGGGSKSGRRICRFQNGSNCLSVGSTGRWTLREAD